MCPKGGTVPPALGVGWITPGAIPSPACDRFRNRNVSQLRTIKCVEKFFRASWESFFLLFGVYLWWVPVSHRREPWLTAPYLPAPTGSWNTEEGSLESARKMEHEGHKMPTLCLDQCYSKGRVNRCHLSVLIWTQKQRVVLRSFCSDLTWPRHVSVWPEDLCSWTG